MRKLVFLTLLFTLFAIGIQAQKVTQGELNAVGTEGKPLGLVPLKHTDVKAEISGFLSRVKVTQEFENNFAEKIEAVYVFPLPNNAAVDDMTMRIGERTVRGKIMKREEAREVYEAARSNGQIASLLDQERTNIFTQSVANILPGEKITIEISYVETLKYEAGSYEFVFPMVVGPRYIPGDPNGRTGTGFAPDTTRVPDASRITPMPAKDRAGHDISIEVKLDAGVLIEKVESKSHQISSTMLSGNSYDVKLRNQNSIPNRDFILKYDVAGKRIEDAVLTHRSDKGGFFTMILQPPDNPRAQDITPKEIVFVIDTSGSMSGFPLDKAKESMKMALEGLNPQDTFNLITFAGDTAILFEKPVPANRENLNKAQAFLDSRQGGGGTEMMKAIKASMDPSDSQKHIRIVCFMTDGYIGNDGEIISEIQKHPNARVFSFGIGSSVNRNLLDKMAEEGRGEVEYVSLNDDGSAAAKRFHERVRSPLLTDISVHFGNLEVDDVYPRRINDLFSAKPVIIHGRYKKGGSGTIKLKGKSSGVETVREIPVNFPENEPNHDVLATLWARTRIDDLTKLDYAGVQNRTAKPEIADTITNLGLEFRLLTAYTSFVAVEERIVTDGGVPRRIEVPVEMPEGVSRAGIFGEDDETNYGRKQKMYAPMKAVNRPNPVVDKSDTKVKREGFGIGSGSPVDQAEEKDGDERRTNLPPIKITFAEKPVYPQTAKAFGTVNVDVTINNLGKVISAKAVSGEKSLFQAAESFANKAKFEIPKTDFEIKQIKGTIVFDFAKNKVVSASKTLQNLKIEVKPNKFQSTVKALVLRLNRGGASAPEDAGFVAGGKANLIVRINDLNSATVAELKRNGFEVLTEMTSANAVVGKIAIEKIAALAELESVTFISAQLN